MVTLLLFGLALSAFRAPQERTGRPPVVIVTPDLGKALGHNGRHWRG